MNIKVTCRTENCENAGYGILLTDPEDLVICGPCGEVITDKVEELATQPSDS